MINRCRDLSPWKSEMCKVCDCRRAFEKSADGVARLSNCDEMSCFSYGGRNIRFRTSPRLTRYNKVLLWEKGFIEVLAQYGENVEEEYIDLVSILENLYIDPKSYLLPIRKVEVSNV